MAEVSRRVPWRNGGGWTTVLAQSEDGECAEILPMTPFSFAGERAVVCRLRGVPATAFNVMTLRGGYTHDVRVAEDEIEVELTPCGTS